MSEDTTAVKDPTSTETMPDSDSNPTTETINFTERYSDCLLYTSDAADD